MAKKSPVEFALVLRDTKGRFARSLPKVLTEARRLFAADVTSAFDQSRSPEGVPWAPLKARASLPLILTGKLRKASIRAAEAAVISGGRMAAKLASSAVRYGRFHQQGTKTIPKRRFFGYSKETRKTIPRLIAGVAVQAAKGGRK